MGVISRKIFPAYDSMCVCCPALRSSSRQPVKRYKKLLTDIFPKSQNAPANDRKIVKLCEYAAKNPFRIPKIARYLEQRCYKELRCEHIKFVNIVMEAYVKLLCMCKEQLAYFSVSLLNVVNELLDDSKRDVIHILGCHLLTKFIYSQVDGTYTYNIENWVKKVCMLALQTGEEHEKCRLRASSLQCLSAMLWFMAEFSHIFTDFNQIVHVILENCDPVTANEDDDEESSHHNWVDEVVRCEGRAGAGSEKISSFLMIKQRPEKKDPFLLSREEIETPKVWVQICIQRLVELAKESITMRRILDPMFVHFDNGQHWVPRHGLAAMVLSDMCYFVESTGNQQLILSSVIHHLDHKSISHDPQVKSKVIQVATALARQIRSEAVLLDVEFVSDLCRHLRKCLQVPIESVGEQELNSNISLQNAIEYCLVEVARGIADPRQLFDVMVITLEKLSSVIVVARATVGSMIILAHMISMASVYSSSEQVFPEALLIQLVKVMLHPVVEVRVGAHQIFSALLNPSSSHPRSNVFSHPRKWHSDSAATFASITALLERLRREKGGNDVQKDEDDPRERDIAEKKWKQGQAIKNSPKLHKISSILDKTAVSTSLTEAEPSIMKFSEDQIAQLLSAYWIQINLPDNLPSNVEAIAHSYCLTLIYSRLKNHRNNLVIRFFQLPLSLRRFALDPNNALWPPAYQRLVLKVSTAMLMFAAKLYQIPNLNDLLKSTVECDADSYLGVSDDFQVYVKPQVVLREFGSIADNQESMSLMGELRNKISEFDKKLVDILVQNLSSIVEVQSLTDKLEADDLVKQLSEPFIPDDTFIFDPQSFLNLDQIQIIANSKDTLTCDGDFMANSVVEDDAVSESSVADLSRFIPRLPASPSMSHIVSIGQLMESALVVAGQVAGTSVSASPLPYNTMASQCEALGTCTRKKLSSWLTHESNYRKTSDEVFSTFSADGLSDTTKVSNGRDSTQGAAMLGMDPWLALRLPPASPFDNFLRAARF